MSEELIKRGLTKSGLKIAKYEYYDIGDSTLDQLKKYKIVPNKDYKEYSKRKPDALLVDRRINENIKVIAVIEHKDSIEFKTDKDKKKAIRQCNDLCQVLDANLGIATDNDNYIWFNPNQPDIKNEYIDRTTRAKRSYTLIVNNDNTPYYAAFIIKQEDNNQPENNMSEIGITTIKTLEKILSSINKTNSKIILPKTIDPTILARQIWQDVWVASAANPEKCLYTFVELFIFKYLSDLGILKTDDLGNNINFNYILSLDPTVSFKNYYANVRPYLRHMFPEDKEDGTTIINGTVLNPNVPEHSLVFHNILKRFDKFGELKDINPDFKTRLFEQFMKESISKKNWGQYFTPRVIIDSIVEMSEIDKLPENSKVCDPACGVGGFILQPIKVRPDGLNYYYKIENKKVVSRLNFIGYDKGFEKEEQLTTILAKANMLIYVSELLKGSPNLSNSFAQLFSKTFKLLNKSILGSLSITKKNEYDLIMTNPPYAQKGSKNLKDAIYNNGELKDFYTVDATGVEGLFVEKIVRELKPDRKAFIIIPHSILDRLFDLKLREFIMKECIIDAIISLPQKTFYKTRKKTYILCITRKSNTEIKQSTPIFTYLVTQIGESLDIYRAITPDNNDLPHMVKEFKYFSVDKVHYSTTSPRIKILSPSDLIANIKNWCIDRLWSKQEKIDLGIEEEEDIVDLDQYKNRINEAQENLKNLYENLVTKESESYEYAIEPLYKIFTIKQGNSFYTKKRILSEGWVGIIPVYSSNTKNNGLLIGIQESAIKDEDKYYQPCLTWSVDGDAGSVFVRNQENINCNKIPKYLFTINNHCGVLLPNKENLDLGYCKIILEPLFKKASRSYDNYKVGTNQIENIEIKIPIDEKGQYDIKAQKEIADKYEELYKVQSEIKEQFINLSNIQVDLI